MAENKKMKTLTLGGETFEVTDEVARNEIKKLKEEGSGGVQPDLAQNDPTAPDYVKNRTHWTDDDGTVHKLDAKYLPDDIGGGGNTVIRINVDSEGGFSANMTYEELCNHYDNKTLCGGVFVEDDFYDLGKYFTPLGKMSDNRGAFNPCFYLEFYHTVDDSRVCYYRNNGQILDYNPNGK